MSNGYLFEKIYLKSTRSWPVKNLQR